jgi:uncharacterized protein
MATANSPIPSMNVHASRSSAAVVQRVPPAAEETFLEWQRAASLAAERFPGYSSTDLYPPVAGRGDEWVVLIHFQDEASLSRWLDSPERARRVEELRAKVGDFDLKTLEDGFGPWFVRQGQAEPAAPTAWKMALTVLLALFPTVMVLTILVGPLTSPLGLAASMLIGNAMSISILQWVVMPRLTKKLDPWFRGGQSAWRFTPVLILLTLAVLTALFRQVTG